MDPAGDPEVLHVLQKIYTALLVLILLVWMLVVDNC